MNQVNASENKRLYEFGAFRLDPSERVLARKGKRIPLAPKAFDTLLILVQHSGHVLTKDELIKTLWPDSFVEENNLTQNISALRRALGEGPAEQEYIETVPKLGYRFVSEVREVGGDPSAALSTGASEVVVSKRTRTRIVLREEEEEESEEASDYSAPQEHVVAIKPQAIQEIERKRQARRVRWVWAAVALLLVAAAAVTLDRWLAGPLPQPRVLRTVRLTNDGQPKYAPLVSDGVYLYFNERIHGHQTIVQVSLSGESHAVLPTAELKLLDVSSSGSTLLAAAENSTEPDSPLWLVPLPAGDPRPLGVKGRAAAWSPDGEQFAYINGADLWVAKKDGPEPRKLAALGGIAENLRWSPDGGTLRFDLQDLRQGSRDATWLWEVSADGTNLRQVLPHVTNPLTRIISGDWSMKGDYFLFQSGTLPTGDLWVRRERPRIFPPAANQPIQLTNGPIGFVAPVSSRDGRKVFALGQLAHGELARVDWRSHQVSAYLTGVSADGVAFSEDGQWVAYTLWPERTLWRSRIDGSERLQLTFAGRGALTPRWSPDGRTIAFVGYTPSERLRYKIYLISAAGGKPEGFIPGDSDQASPTWSPDGKSLAFAGAPWLKGFSPESTAVHVYDFTRRQATTLPGSEGLWAPKWSPDGRAIVAETIDSRGLKLFDVRARRWKSLARFESQIGYPCWSHDGKFLYLNTFPEQTVYRIQISSGREESVLSLKDIHIVDALGPWFGLAPDDSPLVLRDTSVVEIYALDVSFP